MKTRLYFGIGVVFLIAIGWILFNRLGFFQRGIAPGDIIRTDTASRAPERSEENVAYIVEEVAGGLEVPWSITFTDPERILVTERPGRLRVIERGILREEPLHVFDGVSTSGEEGLMSLTLDPNYPENKFLYVAYAYENSRQMYVRVLRFHDDGIALSQEKVIMDRIPAARFHAGCRLIFGPDGKLYITTGDATERALAQDLDSLAGKILRLNSDGTVPEDNPFPGSPVWSYGHRNPQGLFWHPLNGELYATEHGPSGFDGPAGGDEINRIVKGGNYGWPVVSHEKTSEGTIAPLKVFTPAEAPASLLVYSGSVLPQFQGDLFFGALKGEGLVRIGIDPMNPDRITEIEKLKEVNFGRIRAVTEGPDGYIYFSTSNRDGRGKPTQNDDRILRIRPGEVALH